MEASQAEDSTAALQLVTPEADPASSIAKSFTECWGLLGSELAASQFLFHSLLMLVLSHFLLLIQALNVVFFVVDYKILGLKGHWRSKGLCMGSTAEIFP